jgi:outer membrane protein assembly factor BamB
VGPDGTIFFGSTDSFFYALWPDGSLRWQAATGDQIKFCSPAVTETGVVYFGSYDGFVYALTTDQQFLWAYPTGHVVRSSPAIGADGRIYIGSDTRLLALTPDGNLDWDYETGGLVISSPVYFDDDLVIGVGSDDGAFYCLHDDGSLDWRYTVGAPIRSVPSPSASGNIYVADMSGIVWAFGDGEPNAIGDAPPAPRAGLQLVAAPNPTSGTVIFRVANGGHAADAIIVYDVLGREIDRLLTGGSRAFLWDGRDRGGRPLPAGTYFYRGAGDQRVGRLVIVR